MDEKIKKILAPHWGKKKKQRKPFPCLNRYGLLGFYSEAQKITLDKNNIIKKVSSKQRDEFYQRSGLKNNDELRSKYDYMFFHYYQGSITSPLGTSTNRQRHLLVFLKMFLNKSIALPYHIKYGKSKETDRFESMGFVTIPKEHFYEEEPYYLPKKDLPEFKKLWKSYSEIDLTTNKAFAIVVNRYYFSLQRIYPEDRIIDLMIAFEALFLKATSELSFRLALTVTKFLEHRYKRESLFHFIKQSYNLRSKIAHGTNLKPKDLKFLGKELTSEQFAINLTEVLRVSMYEYVKNHSSVKISDFIDKIENALIRGEEL